MRQKILILFFTVINSVCALCQQNEGVLFSRVVLLEDSVCSSAILTKINIDKLNKSFGVSIEDSLKNFSSQYVKARKRIMYSIALEKKTIIIVSGVPLFDLDKYFLWLGIIFPEEELDETFDGAWWAEETKKLPVKTFTHPKFK